MCKTYQNQATARKGRNSHHLEQQSVNNLVKKEVDMETMDSSEPVYSADTGQHAPSPRRAEAALWGRSAAQPGLPAQLQQSWPENLTGGQGVLRPPMWTCHQSPQTRLQTP